VLLKRSEKKLRLALNRALAKRNLPTFILVVDTGYTRTRALSSVHPLEKGLGTMLLPYCYRDLSFAKAIKQTLSIKEMLATEIARWRNRFRAKCYRLDPALSLPHGLPSSDE
jgi:hypothetical protein